MKVGIVQESAVLLASNPAGEHLKTNNLSFFAQEHGLTVGSLHLLSKGKWLQYKGWTAA